MKKFIIAAAMTLALAVFAAPAAWAQESAFTVQPIEYEEDQALEPLDVPNSFTVEFTGEYWDLSSRSMLNMVNEFRTSGDAWYWNSSNSQKIYTGKLPALKYDAYLEKIAQQRAAEIALWFDHQRPNGQLCWEAYDEIGGTFYSVGENIAAGYSSTYGTYMQWREDDEDYAGQGHRRNMLSTEFNAVGIACVGVNGYYYWVQEFGYAPDVTNPASSYEPRNAAVRVAILNQNVYDGAIASAFPASITLIGQGATENIPAVNVESLQLQPMYGGYWWGEKVNGRIVSADWTPASTGQVSVNRGVVTALVDFPSTTIRANIMGGNYSIAIRSEAGSMLHAFAPGWKIVKYDKGTAPAANTVMTYKGSPMYWAPNPNGGGSWVRLVSSSTTTVNQGDFGTISGTKTVISRPGTTGSNGIICGDSNNNKAINVVDSQIIYDMARGKYATSKFSEQRWLAADVNNDGTLNANDAFAVQYRAINGTWG